MCSPEPGAGVRSHDGRGGGKSRTGHNSSIGGGSSNGGGGGRGGKFGSIGGGGLLEFWSCLDPKQRDSLLTIKGRSVMETMDCELCLELLASATRLIDEGSKADMPRPVPAKPAPNTAPGGAGGKSKPQKPKARPKEKVVGLRLLKDGTYVPDFTTGGAKGQGQGFVKYSQGVFTIEQREALDLAVTEMSAMMAPWEEIEEDERCYCDGKFLIRVVDMLTYPKPVRKFEVLLDKNTKVSALRDIMVAEVKVESVAKLVLLTKGKPIGHDKNDLTLQELGFRSWQQLVVSQVLGGPTQDETGIEEKNRQFVGDLLFGGTTANNDSSAPKLNKASTSSPSSVLGVPSPLLRPPLPSPPPRPSLPLELPGTSSENSVSGRDALGGKGFKGAVGAGALLEIVAEPGERDGGGAAVGGEEGAVRNREGSRADAGQQAQQEQQQPLMANHGYQVLGQTLERLARAKVAEAWRAELEARENEIRLLEELEAEGGAGEDDGASKRRSKKAKRKERDKKRRDDEKRLQDEEEAKRELLRQEKIRLAEERVEEERRARLLQEREEHERQEAQWKIAQERRQLVEREQLELQRVLLSKQKTAESVGWIASTAVTQRDVAVSQNASGGVAGGKDKKSKAKKLQQQHPPRATAPTSGLGSGQGQGAQALPQQRKHHPYLTAKSNKSAGAGGDGSKGSGGNDDGGSTISTVIGNESGVLVHGDPHPLSSSSSSSLSSSPPCHVTLSSAVAGATPPPDAGAVSQEALVYGHPPVSSTVQHQEAFSAATQYALADLMASPPGLSDRVIVPPRGTVSGAGGIVAAAAPALPVPSGLDGARMMGGGVGGFCAFCGRRLVAATANFCTYCGERVIRSPPDPGRTSLAPNPAERLPIPSKTTSQQAAMSLAVGGELPSAMSMSTSAPPHAHGGHPGPVGGGRGGHHHHLQLQSPPPSVPPTPITTSTTSSPSSLAHNMASLTIGCNPAGAGGGTIVGSSGNIDLSGAASAVPAVSSSLPFFVQFRGGGDVGGAERSGGGGIATTTAASRIGMCRSVGDGAASDSSCHSVLPTGAQGLPGAAGDSGPGATSSTFEGILGTGLGGLGSGGAPGKRVIGNDRASDTSDGRRPW